MARKKTKSSYSAATDSKFQQTAQSPSQTPGKAERKTRIERKLLDIGGILLISLASMTLIALLIPDISSGLLGWWSKILGTWFGWGTIWVVLTLAGIGVWMLREHDDRIKNMPWGRIIALEVAAFTSLAFLAVLGGGSILKAEAGYGGRIGWALSNLFSTVFEPLGIFGVILVGMLLLSALVISLLSGLGLYAPLLRSAREMTRDPGDAIADVMPADPAVSESPIQGEELSGGDQDPAAKRSRMKRQTGDQHPTCPIAR
jgi:hypothetical protein